MLSAPRPRSVVVAIRASSMPSLVTRSAARQRRSRNLVRLLPSVPPRPVLTIRDLRCRPSRPRSNASPPQRPPRPSFHFRSLRLLPRRSLMHTPTAVQPEPTPATPLSQWLHRRAFRTASRAAPPPAPRPAPRRRSARYSTSSRPSMPVKPLARSECRFHRCPPRRSRAR